MMGAMGQPAMGKYPNFMMNNGDFRDESDFYNLADSKQFF
jgi:hypothetical protein